MQKVFIASDAIEANFVRDLLERGGVTATIQGETLAPLRPLIGLDPDTLQSVWIADDSQLKTVRKLLEDYERETKH